MLKKLAFVLGLVFLSGCANGLSNTSTPTGEPASSTPRFIPSSSPSPTATSNPSPTLEFVNIPTPTLTLYTVVINDNLTSIAKKFNITLEELLAANPKIGSQALTVGTVLTIPTSQVSSSVPTATPVPVTLQQVQCYPNQDGSLYCLALLKNDHPETFQNLSVLITLVGPDGTILNSQTAYSPLDLLPSGKSIPMITLFQAPVPQNWQPQARLLTASLLLSANSLYPSISLQNSLVEVDWGGLNARIRGQAFLSASNLKASRVWVLAVAYDQVGNVIGFTRWESNFTLSYPDHLSFEFTVASLGPQIDHVDLLVEAAK
jgi:LysM repeat protein